jgi:hypothetical protein
VKNYKYLPSGAPFIHFVNPVSFYIKLKTKLYP